MKPFSYWQQTAARPVGISLSPHQTQIETEYCIIGAGIAGSSAAWHLAQRGCEAVVIDAREPALGASGRNAGMIVASGAAGYLNDIEAFGLERAKQIQQIAIENRNGLIECAERLGVPVWRSGYVTLADSEAERDAARQTAELLRRDGFEAEWIDVYPFGKAFYGALKLPNEAVTQPAALTAGILEESGQQLITQTRVVAVEDGPLGAKAICEGGLVVDCEQVFIASNAYTSQWRPEFADKITPGRGQIQVSTPVPMVEKTAFGSQFGFYYFRQVPDAEDPTLGRWLMGGGRNIDFDTENGHYDEVPTETIQDALEAFTERHFPELEAPQIEYRWAGIMGFTENHLPLIGRLEELPAAVYCVGFSGHGMGLAFKATEVAVDYMLNDTRPRPFVE